MIAASILLGRAIAPIEQIVGQWRTIVSARQAFLSLSNVLENVPRERARMDLPSLKGHLSVENVYATLTGSDAPILKGVSFELVPGDILGVLGPSAAGKSTLARVLMAVWPVESGAIRLDGSELKAYDQERLGGQVGYLPQQVDLLQGSVRENIARFDPDAGDLEIIEAARAADCHELILRLQDGYDTEIGPSGAYLSAGQRQRVGLARALFRSPAFVVLDEPNSNLDAPGEEALQKAISSLRDRAATVIVIAHRPGTISHCNKLLVLDDGCVTAFGLRDDILQLILKRSRPVNGAGDRNDSVPVP